MANFRHSKRQPQSFLGNIFIEVLGPAKKRAKEFRTHETGNTYYVNTFGMVYQIDEYAGKHKLIEELPENVTNVNDWDGALISLDYYNNENDHGTVQTPYINFCNHWMNNQWSSLQATSK